MKYLLILCLLSIGCGSIKSIPKVEPTIKVDTYYVYRPPVIDIDTILQPEITYLDTTICPVDTIERTIIKTKVIKGETKLITKTVSDTVVVRIRETIPQSCPEITEDNLLWKIISGSTSLLFLLFLFFKQKKK